MLARGRMRALSLLENSWAANNIYHAAGVIYYAPAATTVPQSLYSNFMEINSNVE